MSDNRESAVEATANEKKLAPLNRSDSLGATYPARPMQRSQRLHIASPTPSADRPSAQSGATRSSCAGRLGVGAEGTVSECRRSAGGVDAVACGQVEQLGNPSVARPDLVGVSRPPRVDDRPPDPLDAVPRLEPERSSFSSTAIRAHHLRSLRISQVPLAARHDRRLAASEQRSSPTQERQQFLLVDGRWGRSRQSARLYVARKCVAASQEWWKNSRTSDDSCSQTFTATRWRLHRRVDVDA